MILLTGPLDKINGYENDNGKMIVWINLDPEQLARALRCVDLNRADKVTIRELSVEVAE